jgi:chloramphenicol O-acetyltransferase type A
MKILDLNNWNRKDHFEFFKQFDQPFFGITAEVEITKAYQNSKARNQSLFLYYLHKSLVAINQLEYFKYRINERGDVVVYETIRGGATVNRADGTFSFSFLEYHNRFQEFEIKANEVIENIRNSNGLTNRDRDMDVCYFSAIPWIKFTSIEHAMNSNADSIPRIAFGKWEERDGKKYMPVSVHVHHALMDGVHVGEFYELFQKLLDEV